MGKETKKPVTKKFVITGDADGKTGVIISKEYTSKELAVEALKVLKAGLKGLKTVAYANLKVEPVEDKKHLKEAEMYFPEASHLLCEYGHNWYDDDEELDDAEDKEFKDAMDDDFEGKPVEEAAEEGEEDETADDEEAEEVSPDEVTDVLKAAIGPLVAKHGVESVVDALNTYFEGLVSEEETEE